MLKFHTLGVRQKILLAFGAACMTVVIFTGVVTELQLVSIERSARLEARNLAMSMAYAAASRLGTLQQYIEGLDGIYKRDIFVVDTHKKTIADVVPSEIGEPYADDPDNEVGRTIADGQVRMFVEKSGQHPGSAKQIVVPIHQGGRAGAPIVGAVVLEYSNIQDELLRDSLTQIYVVAGAGLLCVVLIGVCGNGLGVSILNRLKRFQSGVERIAGGHYDVRLPVSVHDEIGVLQTAFNVMAEDLAANRDQLTLEMENTRAAARQVEHLAHHDKLTNLANRALFSRLLERALLDARRHGRHLAVMFVDLDRFKNINDTLGHDAGDELLREVAARLLSTLRASDLVARLGGDEFVILLSDVADEQGLATVAQQLLAAVAQPCVIQGQEFRVTASIGISTFPIDGIDEPTLMKHADIAMYRAKEEGKNTFAFYAEEFNKHSVERLAFESSLRHALEAGQFEVHYQPKVDCHDGCMTGVEALLRWSHPDLGMVPPVKFIPIAEETGLIVPLGRWVLETACRQQVAWRRLGMPPLRMAVNLSTRQFDDDNLLADVKAVIAATGIDPACLEIEITESMLVRDARRATEVLTAFKALGIRLSVDDFGTGYSSLSNLKRFPVDTIKVDRSFIRDLSSDHEDQAIAQAIISMGRTLGMTVIAEGVETHEQVEFLRVWGCDEIQGFYYSKALPAQAIAELVKAHPSGVLPGKDVVQVLRTRSPDSAFMAMM